MSKTKSKLKQFIIISYAILVSISVSTTQRL